MVESETYHITSADHYRIQRRSSDALPYSSSLTSSLGSSMIIFRDSDLYNRPTNLHKRQRVQEDDSTCGAALLQLAAPNPFRDTTTPSSGFEYYYPPNLTTTVPMTSYDPNAVWTDILKSGHLVKRQVIVNAAGPSPVPEGCPTNRLVNYMVTKKIFLAVVIILHRLCININYIHIYIYVCVFWCGIRELRQTARMFNAMEELLLQGNKYLQTSTRPQASMRAPLMSPWASSPSTLSPRAVRPHRSKAKNGTSRAPPPHIP